MTHKTSQSDKEYMKQSTSFAQVATNLLTVLQGYTKGIRLLLVMFVALTVTTNAWGQTWTRVTTMEQLTSGGTFIMGYEATAKSGTIVPLRSADCDATTSANGYFHTGTTANSSTSSTITMSSVVNTSAYEVYISSPASGKINIQRATSTGNYYGASSEGSSKNTARLYTKGNTTETNLIVEWASETNNQFKLRTGVSGTYKYLKYNTSSPRFAFYNSAGEKIVFYKKSATSFTVTATSNNNNYGTVSVNGTTITAEPADCYQVVSGNGGYTINSGTATVTHEGNSNTLTVNASTDCSIQVNFEKKPVNTYIDNVQNNESVELCGTHDRPSLSDKTAKTEGTCEELHWHFMGWVTEANKEDPTDVNIVKANTSVTANGTTYYAVWAIGTTTGGDTSKQYSFDITPSDFNSTSYAANNNEKISTAKASDGSTLSVKWTSNQVMLQSSAMQWQKSAGYIYNSTDLGTINSVTVTESAGTFTTYYGTSKQPSSNTTVGNGYFQIKVGDATGKTSKVTITFTKTTQGAQTTTYSDYTTSCTEPSTFTVTYIGNGNTSGSVPEDNTEYAKDAQVIVLGNTGNLAKTGYTFSGWNTKANGTGTTYAEGANFNITENTTLYAQWTAKTATSLSWSETSYAATIDADNTFPTLTILPNDLTGVTYSSSNTSVATIDANSNITLVSAGTTTITATFTETATHTGATASYTLTVNPSNCRWVETEIGEIEPEDEVLVTMKLNSGDTYTLDHSKGTTELPPAQIIGINGNEATFLSLYHNNSIWNISGNATDGYILYPNGSETTWLYCTKSNKNVKVGTTKNNVFAIDNGYLKHTNTTELWIAYLGVYINGASTVWHHENSSTATSITGQTLKFYKRECLDSEHYWVTWDANEGTWTDGSSNKLESYQVGATITAPTENPSREGYRFDGWNPAPTTMPAKNTTFTAQWSKLYNITLSENGKTTTPTTQTSTSYTLPTELSIGTCENDEKELVGWSTVEIPNPGDKPTSNFHELGATVTLTADQTTFYAVFAIAEGALSNDYNKITDINNLTDGNYVIAYGYNTTSPSIILKAETNDATTLVATSAAPTNDKYTSPAAANVWEIKKNSSIYTLYNKSTSKYIQATNTSTLKLSDSDPTEFQISYSNDHWKIKLNTATTYQLVGYTNSSGNYFQTKSDASDRYKVQLYKNASTIVYSDYSTTCVKLPNPVLSFATEPANPIVFTDAVCGGNSSKQSVTVVGENLRDVVEVSVTGPYKIARTSSAALKDFTTSLTLDKTAGGAIHGNYQTVYIISTPPAQSTDATTGTLTFTTTKGNILTVNLSTPTVTCTQYTLTLVDRGVSTEQPTKYYAGETIDEAPADPEGVCTDPIHYVFDGWAAATVSEGSTEYTKVTFPYTVTGNTKFYAVYRYLEGGGNGDYNLVTSALDDWSGDYLIAYSDQIFANGTTSGESGIGAKNNKVDLSSNISNNIIPATVGDQYNVTLEAVTGGYVLKTQDGKYNYYTTNTSNGISISDKGTADNYPITVEFVSDEEINLRLGGNAIGSVFRYNPDGYFRFYKNGGQQPVYLYKKADGTTYYTTSPICGPHLAITEGKEIYVTGGNAGGTRDLVIAQQKVSYKATRLQTSNGLADGTAPDVKVATNGITVGGVVTSDVKVAIDQTKEQQPDGTYAITGDIVVTYKPRINGVYENIDVRLAVDYNTDATDNFTVHARSLPAKFVIVVKSGDKWYALNGDMANGSSANPANGQVTLNDDINPTKATYAPCNTIYTLDGVPNTGDRTRVRFQGTDGAWLWAASGTNVGIQNKSLKEIPEGNNKAYNWKLETDDNITYKFHNDNSSRLLGLSGEKFGMYASGVQDIRILPYEAKCLYNYAPSNLKVTVLKGTYVTLTWDAVAGATKYQYSTDATNWTDAGTEPTATITGLTGDTEYTYYIRAYHEDAGVTTECIDYAEITFTTADCDDVPTDITYTADLNSITVSWTAAAPTATITYNTKEDGTGGGGTINNATSPCRISGGLNKNTTYYIQILAGGTCASPIIPVKTEDVEVDIVEWQPQGIIVDINTDETIGVTLENEVSYGSGLGTEATELFFSKYYEASYNVKLVAIYNGTKNIIDLTDYIIKYGKTGWESNYITLKDFGATKGQIQPGEEIILYSYTENNADDKKILDCVHDAFPDGNWVRVTNNNNTGKGILAFGGDKTLALFKGTDIIDIIGAVDGSNPNNSKANEKPTWGDANGWICATGHSLADNSEIGISTNRCLLVRNNTVTSGANAVASNTTDFVTLCSEWKGAHVLDSDVDNGIQESCENFAYVGTFDYSDYYTKYVPMGEGTTFDKNARNADGTVTIPITDLYKHSCSNIRVKLTNSNGEVLSDREYKVPIMITTTQGTDGQAFLDLQENLATVEVDGEGNVIKTYPLSLDEVREICKTCDVVVRDNATLTKIADDAANDHPEVHDIFVYENSSLIVPNGTNYTINNLSLRRKQDAVASLNIHPDALKLPASAAAPISLDFRLSAESWHWFTLPYDCNINEVTWADGTPAQYNTDWYLMTYDGEKRAETQAGGCWKAYTGTTINAGDGFIIAINGNINNPAHTYELRFPMSKEVLAAEGTDKTVAVRAWGVETNIRPNHKGWNLIGNPYLAYYQRDNITNFQGLRLGQLTGPNPQTGYWEQSGDVPYVVVPIGAGWEAYEQLLASETDLLPFTAYFIQVGKDQEHKSTDNLSISFDHTKLQLSSIPVPASIIQRTGEETNEKEEPVIVGVTLSNSQGESDKTSLVIDNQYTDEYEMNADFFKWFGDYYTYYTKPVLYTIGADQGKRAFNALNEELANQPIAMGIYAAQAGEYTFTLNLRSDLSHVEEVWLHDTYDNIYTNLLQDSYTFFTSKVNGEARFFLSVKMKPEQEQTTDPDVNPDTSLDDIAINQVYATAKDNVIYVYGLLSSKQLWIYDAVGKLIHQDQTKYYQHTYPIPHGGAYFIRVQDTIQTQIIKVVVK